MKARHYSKKLSAQGTFCDAEVIRGADWQWDNQDGNESFCMIITCIMLMHLYTYM